MNKYSKVSLIFKMYSNFKVFEQVWVQSIPTLTKLYPDRFNPINAYDRLTINRFLKNIKLIKKEKSKYYKIDS